MSLERLSIFIEELFQFCFGRRGIIWQPAPKDAQGANADPLFHYIIGIAVLNSCIEFQQDVHQHSTAISRDVSNLLLSFPARRELISHRIVAVSDDILAGEIYASETQATYVFLAVMVDVATQSVRNGNHELVRDFASIIAQILDSNMPYDFIQKFDIFLMYAVLHSQPPGN